MSNPFDTSLAESRRYWTRLVEALEDMPNEGALETGPSLGANIDRLAGWGDATPYSSATVGGATAIRLRAGYDTYNRLRARLRTRMNVAMTALGRSAGSQGVQIAVAPPPKAEDASLMGSIFGAAGLSWSGFLDGFGDGASTLRKAVPWVIGGVVVVAGFYVVNSVRGLAK